jgi:hypothetical protein
MVDMGSGPMARTAHVVLVFTVATTCALLFLFSLDVIAPGRASVPVPFEDF